MKPEGAAACEALGEAEDTYRTMCDRLQRLRGRLATVVAKPGWQQDGPEGADAGEDATPPEGADAGGLPGHIGRLHFEVCGVSLFVDFAVDVGESAGELDVSGRVIYGAVRWTCVSEDRRAKALCEFTVSRNGLIEDPAGLRGKWYLSDAAPEKPEELPFKDLHCLMVKKVLPEGAQWARQMRTADRG